MTALCVAAFLIAGCSKERKYEEQKRERHEEETIGNLLDSDEYSDEAIPEEDVFEEDEEIIVTPENTNNTKQ